MSRQFRNLLGPLRGAGRAGRRNAIFESKYQKAARIEIIYDAP